LIKLENGLLDNLHYWA